MRSAAGRPACGDPPRRETQSLSQKKGRGARGFRKQFFSEEKNQKTFSPALAATWWPIPAVCPPQTDKSLLVVFFRKELLPLSL
jgi:hypothetical protein